MNSHTTADGPLTSSIDPSVERVFVGIPDHPTPVVIRMQALRMAADTVAREISLKREDVGDAALAGRVVGVAREFERFLAGGDQQ